MKNILFYTIAFSTMLGCTKTSESKSDIFVPEKTKIDTLYHIAAIDGDLIYYDSIRIETRNFPERCIRWISSDDCIVFIGSDTLTYEEYRDRYYKPVATYTYAHADMITNIHTPGFYNVIDIDRWALRSILLTGYRP